jgi:tol-pal system protein YbgF
MKHLSFITLLFLMALITGCAARSDVIVLDDRLASVEGQIEQEKNRLEKYGQAVDTKEQDLRSQSATLRVEIESLREQIGILTGRLEEVEYLVREDRKNLEDAGKNKTSELGRMQDNLSQYDNRITRIEEYLDLETVRPSPATTPSQPKEPPAGDDRLAGTEHEMYSKAKQAFDAGNLDAARDGFQEMLKRYPQSNNADNAQFWIGEIYYQEKWFEKAIVEYQKVIENYPKGNKVKSALLKQGYAFLNIGDKSNARIILKELIKKYPDSSEAQIANRKLSQIK